MRLQKDQVRPALSFGLVFLGICSVVVLGYQSVLAVNGFSPNQELALPLTGGNLPVQFIVRALEPGIRIDQQGTVYVDSIPPLPPGPNVPILCAALFFVAERLAVRADLDF
jgi:hypothetical protein